MRWRSSNPRFARVYPSVAARADRRAGRRGTGSDFVEGLAGRVVEVGAGNGRNFAHYPAAVTEVVAIEPEPTLRALAEGADERCRSRCSTGSRRTCRSPTASSTQRSSAWCSAACPTRGRARGDPARAPAGRRAAFYRHVVPPRQPKRALFRAADATGSWPKLAAGCHLARDSAGCDHGRGVPDRPLRTDRVPLGGGRTAPLVPPRQRPPMSSRAARDVSPAMSTQRITTNLWFDTQAVEAAEYYCSIFEDSRIVKRHRLSRGNGQGGHADGRRVGDARAAVHRRSTAGRSSRSARRSRWPIECDDQAEIDRYWARLTDGGYEGPCGWCKDRYGLSWQIMPRDMNRFFTGDPSGARGPRRRCSRCASSTSPGWRRPRAQPSRRRSAFRTVVSVSRALLVAVVFLAWAAPAHGERRRRWPSTAGSRSRTSVRANRTARRSRPGPTHAAARL